MIKPHLTKIGMSATLALKDHQLKLINQGKKVYKFGFGQSPFPVPDCMQEELRKNAHQKDYLPTQGLPALRD